MSASIQFTDEQEQIINFDEGALLVQAGPGSGKTAVLTQRIIRLLKNSIGQNFRILALTFTAKAAENMRQRIEHVIGDEWQRATVLTFHAFGLEVLRHYGEHIGLHHSIRIYEQEEDRLALLAKALLQEGLVTNDARPDDRQLMNLLHQISLRKRALIPPEAIATIDNDAIKFKAAYAGYNRQLELHHGVDFDDLLWLTYRLFVEAPRVVRHYRRIYRFILIDEAQDTSHAQYEILKALCGDEHRNVMMVADADQSIYRFAGASDRYIQLFQKDFGATLMPLRHNFRSTPEIVQIANQLIQHSTRLPGAPLMVSNVANNDSVVVLHDEETQEQEARWVAEKVLKLENQLREERKITTGKDEPQFSEIAILARNRYLLEPIQVALKAQAIPYHFHAANEGLFATSPARIFYLILRVLHNPFDLIHREILLTDLGISPNNFDTTFDGLNGNTASAFFSIIAEKQETSSCWRDFIKTLLAEVNNAAKISEYYANLLAAFEQQVFPCETDAKHDELLQRDLQLLKDKFQAFSHKHSREELDLEGFLGELALSGKSEFEGNAVHVLTLHAAKGLEFEAVFIVGMNQGSFPDYRSLRISSGLDEERRNAYVAVTRAKRMLYLTRCRQRQMPWGANQVQTPSKFLNEMGLI